jgi:hypothetical protein
MLKNKSYLNFVFDVLMFMDMTIIAGLGFLMKYTLPPGRERFLASGDTARSQFLGLDRHQWGSIHLYAALFLLFILAVHIFLHWNMIIGIYRNMIKSKSIRIVLAVIFTSACVVFLIFPFFIRPMENRNSNNLQRNYSSHRNKSYSDGTYASSKNGQVDITRHRGQSDSNRNENETLRGSMTIGEVASACNITPDDVKKRLNIPYKVSTDETIGQLKRQFGFTMQQVRESIPECD